MALPGCTISVGTDGPTAYVRLAGRASAEWAPSFEKAVLRMKAGGAHRVVLELSGALLMDSGFSGMLSRLINHSGVEFVIHRAPSRILDGLADHGVLDMVALMDETGECSLPAANDAFDMPASTRSEVLACCLDSHRALMALKPENVAKFTAVEQYLAKELARDAEAAGR